MVFGWCKPGHIEKIETDRSTVSESWTGSTAALPTAGFCGKKDREEWHVQLISTVLPCINISYHVSNLKAFSLNLHALG